MRGLECFSMLALAITGSTQPWLHYLPLLSGFCSVGYLLVIAAMRSLKKNPENRETGSSITRFASRLSKIVKRTDGASKYAPIWFSCFICGALVYGVTRAPGYHIYEYHNVKVLSKVARNKWTIEREDGTRTLYTGCNDFQNDKVIWAGYVAKTIRYEDQGGCNSILKPGLGFYWDRDERANVKEIPYGS